MSLKILTFNHHESYLCSLSAVGHEFDVVTRYRGLDLAWNVRSRAVPTNFRLVEFDDSVVNRLENGYYDVVVCHTIRNLIWMWRYRKPDFVFVAHIPLFRTSFLMWLKAMAKKIIWRAFKKTHRARFLAVSHFKQESWGEDGVTAVLTPEEFPALKTLDGPSGVAIVCNQLLRRGEELGIEMISRLAQELPIKTIGRNPGIFFNLQPKDFHDFQEIVTGFHIYLYTIRRPWGDGYNTAMLEAMKMGMAIVTVPNPSSPIIHGQNGLVGETEAELRQHIIELRLNPDLLKRLGKAAQETIELQFSRNKFISAWQNVLSE